MQKLLVTITIFILICSSVTGAEKTASDKAIAANGWITGIDAKGKSFTFKPETGRTLTILTTESRLKWLKKGDFIRAVYKKQKNGSFLLSSYRKDPTIKPTKKK